MNNIDIFFIDILNILPDETDCYIQSPDLDDDELLQIMEDSDHDYYKKIHLDHENKIFLIEKLKNNNVNEFFQSIEIKKDSILLFEGYDGIDSGIISKSIYIPDWFKKKYKEIWDYSISIDW